MPDQFITFICSGACKKKLHFAVEPPSNCIYLIKRRFCVLYINDNHFLRAIITHFEKKISIYLNSKYFIIAGKSPKWVLNMVFCIIWTHVNICGERRWVTKFEDKVFLISHVFWHELMVCKICYQTFVWFVYYWIFQVRILWYANSGLLILWEDFNLLVLFIKKIFLHRARAEDASSVHVICQQLCACTYVNICAIKDWFIEKL